MVIVRIWLRRGRNSPEKNSLVWQRSRSRRWTALQSGIFAASTRWVHVAGNPPGGPECRERTHMEPSSGALGSTRRPTLPASSQPSVPRVPLRLLLCSHFEKQKRCSVKGKAFLPLAIHLSLGDFRACCPQRSLGSNESPSLRMECHLHSLFGGLSSQLTLAFVSNP